MKWRESVATNLAELAAKQHQISVYYTALATVLNGQDLPEVYSTGIDVDAFVSHILNFKNEVLSDYESLEAYKTQILALQKQIDAINQADEDAAKKFNVDLLTVRQQLAPTYVADAKEAVLQTAQSQAMYLDANVKYLEAIEKKSNEMLSGWDATIKARSKAITMGAILSVIDIITATGISGNAVFRLVHDEGIDMLKNTSIKTFGTAVGLRGGQAGDYVSMWMTQSKFYDSLIQHGIKTSDQGHEYIKGRVNELTGPNSNFQTVVNRLTEFRRDKAQDWFDNWGWRDDMVRSRTRGYEKDKGWHNATQNNPWLSVNEKQHLMMMDYHDYNPDSYKGGYYDYNVDVLDWEKADHFAWQAHALFEWRKSGMMEAPPTTDQHWKDWVNWNWAIPEEEKAKLSSLSTNEWQALWNDWNKFLEYDKEPLYAHP
jgi:hypothetical protein